MRGDFWPATVGAACSRVIVACVRSAAFGAFAAVAAASLNLPSWHSCRRHVRSGAGCWLHFAVLTPAFRAGTVATDRGAAAAHAAATPASVPLMPV
jgi:hypothetical protein